MTAHKKKEKKNSAPSYNFSALHLVHDPQEFAENLFRPLVLVSCNIIEGFSYSVQSFGQFMFYYHVFFKVVIFVVSFSHWSHFFSFQEGVWGRRRLLEGFSYSVQSFGQFMFYYHVFCNVVIFVVSFSHWSHFFNFRKGCEDEEDC